jgi:hypothetical protein
LPPPHLKTCSLRLERLEDRTVPSGSRLWLLQVDNVTGTDAQQLQVVQQRLNVVAGVNLSTAAVGATAVRHLGLDGLVLIQTATDQTYLTVDQSLKGMAGYRYVRADSLGNTPLFSTDSSQPLSPVPGEWVAHFDGFSGTPAAQEHLLQMYLDTTGYGASVEQQLGRDGVFAIHTG